MSELTRDDQAALEWLRSRAGLVTYEGAGKTMAGSERAPFGSDVIKSLRDTGAISIVMRNGKRYVEVRS